MSPSWPPPFFCWRRVLAAPASPFLTVAALFSPPRPESAPVLLSRRCQQRLQRSTMARSALKASLPSAICRAPNSASPAVPSFPCAVAANRPTNRFATARMDAPVSRMLRSRGNCLRLSRNSDLPAQNSLFADGPLPAIRPAQSPVAPSQPVGTILLGIPGETSKTTSDYANSAPAKRGKIGRRGV
jgi:hypothetical protein